MERIFKDLVNVGGQEVPVVPMISDNSLCAHPAYAHLPLSKQVEVIATMLKREDYNQVVLLKAKVDNGLAILNIARMFKEEDVEVVAVICLEISKDAYDTVNRNLKYGVGDGLQYMNDVQRAKDEARRKKLQ
jgi:hypothetical protein